MFSDRGGQLVPVVELAEDILARSDIEGITVLGGEPFEQAGAVADLARRVREGGLTVMVFTGNVREELEGRADPDVNDLLAHVDLLADGPFVAERPGSRFRWLGSQNQRLHVLSPRFREDDPRFFAPNTIEIRIERNRVEVSGWAPAAVSLVEPAGLTELRRRRI